MKELQFSLGEQLEIQKASYAVKSMTRKELEEYAVQAIKLAMLNNAKVRWVVHQHLNPESDS